MEDKKLKGIMLGGSEQPSCSDDQYNVDSFFPMSVAEYEDSLPRGHRFKPTGELLIVDFLLNKIKGMPLPHNKIRAIKVYDFLPGDLFETYKSKRDIAVYFFTVREKKQDNGVGPNLVTVRGDGEGYWMATREMPILSSSTGRKVGDRRSLVYHTSQGVKTHWLMHEYIIGDEFGTSQGVKTPWLMLGDNLDEWVICKIYKEPDMEVEPDIDSPII